jgi:hypothetical protein
LTLVVLIALGVLAVTLAVDMTGLSYKGGDDTKTAKAQLGCKWLAQAIEAYRTAEANTRHEPPTTLHDLVHPPFGGSTFLKNGADDLRDPWGNEFQMERRQHADGEEYILVYTTAPDGTPVSQYGVGKLSRREP